MARPSKIIEALRHECPITPQLQDPSEYQRNAQLVEIARLAAYGSTTHLHIYQRMSAANQATAWRFSKAEVKRRLQVMLQDKRGDGDA